MRDDARVAAAVFALFLVFYAGFGHARFKGTDEVGLYHVTVGLYHRANLVVPVHRHAHVGRDGRIYTPFAIGQAVAALPFYALGDLSRYVLPENWARAIAGPAKRVVRPLPNESRERLESAGIEGPKAVERSVYGGVVQISAVLLYAAAASAALAAALFLLLRGLGATAASSLLTTLLIGACSYPALMSTYFLRHTSETLCVVLAFWLFHGYREHGRIAWLAAGSAAASLTFLMRFPGVLAGPALGLYLGHALWTRRRATPRAGVADLAAVALPLLAAVATHAGLNWIRWGSWFATPMVSGGLETSSSFGTALFGYLLSPGIGVFAYSPLLLLLPWTLRAAWRRWPWECACFALYFVTQLLFFSNYRFWTGLWSAPGPRYLFPSALLLLVPLAAWLDSRPGRGGRIALASLAALGAVVQLGLLLASWPQVMIREQYVGQMPGYGFLFELSESPIPASLRAVADGHIEAWLWKLGAGWRGFEGQPLLAALLVTIWALACTGGARWLWRRVSAPPEPPPQHVR